MLGINRSMRKITYYENILEFKENTKEELNLNEVNNWKLCRTCLVDTDENDVHIQNMSIMDAMRGTILNIKEMLLEITKIKLSKTENLPLQVCNECFSKITELYYFNIQIRKAEKVLTRLAKTFKNHTDVQGSHEAKIEVDDYQEMDSISDVADISIDENETIQDELSKQDSKESSELFEEIFDTEAELAGNETLVFSSEVCALDKDQKSRLLTEIEDHAELRCSSSDDESNLENNLIEYLESCDTDNGELISYSTVETNESVKCKLKENKARPNEKRAASGTTGYRHKQPRVTSPLLVDFDCALCQISFGRQQDLVQHVRDSHPNSKAYKCRVCGNLFSHIQSLSRHMNSHKEAVILNKCEYCSKPFVRADDLKRHLRVHTGERPYVCSICEKTFQQQSDLKCHQKKHAYDDKSVQPRIFECTVCKKGYASRTGLNWHKRKHHTMESHSQDFSLYCLVCEKSFSREPDGKRQSVIHLHPEANKCAGCGEFVSAVLSEAENEKNLEIINEKI